MFVNKMTWLGLLEWIEFVLIMMLGLASAVAIVLFFGLVIWTMFASFFRMIDRSEHK